MRPTPDELAKGLRSLLRDIAPEIKSSQGARNLRRVMGTLRDVRWSEAGFDVLAENAALTQMLRSYRIESDSFGLSKALGASIDTLLGDRDPPGSFAAANQRNQALRSILCEGLDSLRGLPLHASAELRRSMTEGFLDLRA